MPCVYNDDIHQPFRTFAFVVHAVLLDKRIHEERLSRSRRTQNKFVSIVYPIGLHWQICRINFHWDPLPICQPNLKRTLFIFAHGFFKKKQKAESEVVRKKSKGFSSLVL